MGATDLAKLKMQLKLAMQQVSRRDKALAAAAEAKAIVPQTVEQIDALQQKLTEAMDELRARRAEIQKSAAPETAKPPKDKN
jgi:chromosome segregation ATPase